MILVITKEKLNSSVKIYKQLNLFVQVLISNNYLGDAQDGLTSWIIDSLSARMASNEWTWT